MNRKNRKDEAVSPVIATILMVAITVVLAGVLYVWIASLTDDTETGPKALRVEFSDDTGSQSSGTFAAGDNLVVLKQMDGNPIEWGTGSVYKIYAEDENQIRHELKAVEYASGAGTRTDPALSPRVRFTDAGGDASWASDGDSVVLYIYEKGKPVTGMGDNTVTLD